MKVHRWLRNRDLRFFVSLLILVLPLNSGHLRELQFSFMSVLGQTG